MSTISIYSSQVSQTDARQWLRNNPDKVNDPQLLKVADYNVSGSIDSMELSKAATNGVVVLDGTQSFRLGDAQDAPSQIKADAQGHTIANKGLLGIVVMMGSAFGGIAIAQKVHPAIGMGVMAVGMMIGVGISSGK